MNTERNRGVRDAPFVSAVSLLNVELFKLFESFIEHDMTIEHVVDYGFQTGAYLHLILKPSSLISH
jgi:hypothetical protein